jgi:TolB-like protein
MNHGQFAELKRRNVLRAGALYIGAAWALSQGMAQLLPVFDFPNWVVRWFVIAAMIGFPFAMLFSWFYEWTPQGIQRESEIARDASITRETGKKLDRWIIAVLSIAVVLLLANSLVLHTGANPDSALPVPPKSIAVLPFIDMSPARDQSYFSDGMSEEILNALAQVQDLKVAGRTSSFSFKGRDENLRTIGKALGVANILEGSVRKEGDKVRITAQLIQMSDDTHLWSHDYDGDLSDVFTLQDNIARAIAEQLKAVLTVDQKAHLVQAGTTNTDAYNLYLQATDALNHRDYKRMGEAIGWLEQAIRLDPNFAQAHARLAMIHAQGGLSTALRRKRRSDMHGSHLRSTRSSPNRRRRGRTRESAACGGRMSRDEAGEDSTLGRTRLDGIGSGRARVADDRPRGDYGRCRPVQLFLESEMASHASFSCVLRVRPQGRVRRAVGSLRTARWMSTQRVG